MIDEKKVVQRLHEKAMSFDRDASKLQAEEAGWAELRAFRDHPLPREASVAWGYREVARAYRDAIDIVQGREKVECK
jgi:hypothetical protein